MLKGKLFRDSLISAGISIENNRRRVDELNVYPVPDGDTGTNMSMTMSAAARELELADDNITVSQAADIAASALLRGARGNSGVILSLLFRGFSKGFAGLETADCIHIAKAMEIGVEAAYKSVMNPTEGTVLTVARKAAERAGEIAEYSGSIQSFWNEICIAAQEALERTPEQLPVLKKAGVVDAGGQGLVIIYRAMLDVFSGNGIAKKSDKKPVARTFEVTDNSAENEEEIKYSYCTEYIIEKKTGCKDAFMLRAYLETIGDCVVVVEDDEIIKVHVHTDNPGLAIQKALEFGRFVNDPKPKIENMKIQHEMRVKDEKITNRQEFVPIRPEKDFGFVAVAAGHGLEEMFKDLGADCIIKGGQTMNPSTEDILGAIEKIPAKNIYILPNNGNIILAAQQAKDLTKDKAVHVIPTKNIPQGIAAMINFVEGFTPEQNEEAMTEALSEVKSGQVTYAVRDTVIDGKEIKAGNIMGLSDKTIEIVGTDVVDTTIDLLKKMMDEESELITIYYGEEGTKEDAEKIAKAIEGIDDEMEVEIQYGGQPIYYYFVSVE